jgi:hypothetical protein
VIAYHGEDDFYYAFANKVDLEKLEKLKGNLSAHLKNVLYHGSGSSANPRLNEILGI